MKMKRYATSVFLSIVLATLTVAAPIRAEAPPALPVLPIPQNMGVNIHFSAMEQLSANIDYLKKLGVGWIRSDLAWHEIEQSKGVYNFSDYDRLIDALHDAGIKIVMLLDYTNPNYDGGNSPVSPEARAAFVNFSVTAVQRYAGKVNVWEVYNEPNIGFWKPKPDADQYITLANETTAAIHKAAPNTIVVGPALAGPNLDDHFKDFLWPKTYGYLDRVLNSNAAHDWSAITIHPYRDPKQTPETVTVNLDNVRSLMRNHNIDPAQVPLIAGEWGYSTFEKGVDEQTQAAYAVRSFLMAGIQHMPYTIWYDLQDDGNDNGNTEHRFGLLRHGTLWNGDMESKSTKPSFNAVRQFISLLKGYSFDSLLENDTIIVARYAKGSQYAYVAWTTDNAPHMANIALPVGQWIEHHILGNTENHTATAGTRVPVAAQKMPLVVLPAQ